MMEADDVVTYFQVTAHKKRKNKKLYSEEKQKNNMRRGCQSAQKIAKNWLMRFKI